MTAITRMTPYEPVMPSNPRRDHGHVSAYQPDGAKMTQETFSEPVLNALTTVIRAPAAVLSQSDGQIDGGAQGYYAGDVRVLSRLAVDIDGHLLVFVGGATTAETASDITFHYVIPEILFQAMEGPACHVMRRRSLTSAGLEERIEISNAADQPMTLCLRLFAQSDLGDISYIRSGLTTMPLDPTCSRERIRWTRPGLRAELGWDQTPSDTGSRGTLGTASWQVTLDQGQTWAVTVLARASDDRSCEFTPVHPHEERTFTLPDAGRDHDQSLLLQRSIADLRGLILTENGNLGTSFAAAGSPWYFTLFGRDSLWTARLLLPYAPWLAAGTLRVLADRQGNKHDQYSEEQPGRIPHEVRGRKVEVYGVLDLPAIYYGNIDATSLWICLLRETWHAGLPTGALRSYLPNLRAALNWMTTCGDRDGDGLLEYERSSATGLIHQAWKDSRTAIRFTDGRIARPPLATCEAQAYAYDAAMAGAEILEHLGEAGAADWEVWASELKSKFRQQFWLNDHYGPYPAIALDEHKQPVTGAASNMAHLLGTGILNASETSAVAHRLTQEDLNSGRGLRTLSTENAAYNSLSYHRGSVWPHDTAIAILGLIADGYPDQAKSLAGGLLQASTNFDYRLPELYGGNNGTSRDPLTAYPTACGPQAWASAAGIVAVAALNDWPHLLGRPRNQNIGDAVQ